MSGPMDVTNTAAFIHATTTKKRWRCDVCQVQYFDSFDDACAHEEVCKQESALPNKRTKKKKQDEPQNPPNSFFAPRKPATAISNKPSSTKQKAIKSHSFFQPRSKKQKANITKDVVKLNLEDSPLCKQQQQLQSHQQEAVIEILEEEDKDRERTCDMADTLAAMIHTSCGSTPTLTGKQKAKKQNTQIQNLALIFGGKSSDQLLAEHRQAEFQASRKLERQREHDRQEKRCSKKTHYKTSKQQQQKRRQKLLPLAPRFPVPSHCKPDESYLRNEVTIPPAWNTNTPTPVLSKLSGKVTLCSPAKLDGIDHEPYPRDLIQEAFASALIPSSSSTTKKDRLLVDQYSHTLIGSEAQKTQEKLGAWIQEWCQVRHSAMDRMKERQRKLAKTKQKAKRKAIYKDDALWSDDDDQLQSLLVLKGEVGSGKTSLVHLISRQQNCPVLEINTTQARSGASLKHAIQEASQSCSSLDLIKKQQKLNSLEFDSDEPTTSSTLTVILIEEVDLLFQQDVGFWSALAQVKKSAKCPIVLTCNTLPNELLSWNYELLQLSRPTPDECVTKLLQVCQHEGIPFAKKETQLLANIAQVCNCDMRRLLNELQSFLHSSFHNNNKNHGKVVPTNSKLIVTAAGNADEEEGISRSFLPCIESIIPSQVPADEYSIVTLRGQNLSLLLSRATNNLPRVRFGRLDCKSHLVNDTKLLVLCPPQEKTTFVSLTITLPNESLLSSFQVQEQLVGGTRVASRNIIGVEFRLKRPCGSQVKQHQQGDDDYGECEFEAFNNRLDNTDDQKKSSFPSLEKQTIQQQGEELWNRTVLSQPVKTAFESPSSSRISVEDIHLQETLQNLSTSLDNLSDAALLEDLQLPFLSGACPGFAFDLTDGSIARSDDRNEGKLNLHDKRQPPREEKLFDLGWKDNCYFYGNAEAYMTMPQTAKERRLYHHAMTVSRGGSSVNTEGVPTTTAISIVTKEPQDLSNTVNCFSPRPEDDNFLPQPDTIVTSLTMLIRKKSHDWYQNTWTGNQLLDRKRQSKYQEALMLASHLKSLRYEELSSFSATILPFRDALDTTFCLEVLPTLRRISVVERDWERVEGSGCATGRNTRSKKGRRHYFEEKRWEFCQINYRQLSASKLGGIFAETLITYNQK